MRQREREPQPGEQDGDERGDQRLRSGHSRRSWSPAGRAADTARPTVASPAMAMTLAARTRPFLLALAEHQPVVGDRPEQQRGGHRGQDDGAQVQVALARASWSNRLVNGSESRKPNRTCTPSPATRSSCSSSPRLRSAVRPRTRPGVRGLCLVHETTLTAGARAARLSLCWLSLEGVTESSRRTAAPSPRTPSRSTAALIVECLENEGVTHVFGIPGEENIRLVDAIPGPPSGTCWPATSRARRSWPRSTAG